MAEIGIIGVNTEIIDWKPSANFTTYGRDMDMDMPDIWGGGEEFFDFVEDGYNSWDAIMDVAPNEFNAKNWTEWEIIGENTRTSGAEFLMPLGGIMVNMSMRQAIDPTSGNETWIMEARWQNEIIYTSIAVTDESGISTWGIDKAGNMTDVQHIPLGSVLP